MLNLAAGQVKTGSLGATLGDSSSVIRKKTSKYQLGLRRNRLASQ